MLLRKTKLLFPVLLLLFSLWLVLPAFGAGKPVWTGAVDGLMLAKARFLSEGYGLGSWNRYWFLGIPGQYIGSPLVPGLLALLTRTDLVSGGEAEVVFGVWRGLVALGIGLSVIGIYGFGKSLFEERTEHLNSNRKRIRFQRSTSVWEAELFAIFLALFTLLFPSLLSVFPQIRGIVAGFGWPAWMVFSPFFLGDGNATLGYIVVLVAMVVSLRLVRKWDLRKAVLLSFLVALIMLLDSLSILTFIAWLSVVILAVVVNRKLGSGSVVTLVLRMIMILILGILVTGFWFTPGFIITFLGSPSLGGQPFGEMLVNLLNRLLIFLPAVLGIIASRKWLSERNSAVVLGIMGVLIFGTITVASFFADPDFWQDYSRVGRSLDLSTALIVGGVLVDRRISKRGWLIAILSIFIVSLPFFLNREKLFRGEVELMGTAEQRVVEVLAEIVGSDCADASDCGERAYLSGSTVFWLNGWYDVAQVRGGGEQGSLNDWWPHGSYQIREGMDPELSQLWLEAMGVRFLVIHGEGSDEVYHDFRFPKKFERMEGWSEVWEKEGDAIFFNAASGIARKAEMGILNRRSPDKGDDLEALRGYAKLLGQNVDFSWDGKNGMRVKAVLDEGEGVRLAIAFSPFWKIRKSNMALRIKKDALGLMVLQPERAGDIEVMLQFNPWPEVAGGVGLTLFALYVLLKKPALIDQWVGKLHVRLGEDTELDRSAI